MSNRAADVGSTPTAPGRAGDEPEGSEALTAARPVHPYIHVVIVALIGAVAVLAWLLVFEAVVGVFAPIVLFSGETQIRTVAADPTAYGPMLLVAMALVKLALLAVAFKSGFLGGPTFPAIFASVCVALAISQLAPGIPVDVVIGGIMAGFLVVLFKAPLMVILLTAVMLQAGPELVSLILLAVAAVLVAQPYFIAAIAGRQAVRNAGAGDAA